MKLDAYDRRILAALQRDGRLSNVQGDEPLIPPSVIDQVAANINRYRVQPLHIADADLKALTFTGTVKTDAIDDWLHALPQVLPLRVNDSGGQTVLSDARRKPAPH